MVYDVPLPYSRARRLSWYVAADADFPLNKVVMFRYAIKVTSCALCQIVLVSAVGLTLVLQTYARGYRLEFLSGHQLSWEVTCGLSQSLQAYLGLTLRTAHDRFSLDASLTSHPTFARCSLETCDGTKKHK